MGGSKKNKSRGHRNGATLKSRLDQAAPSPPSTTGANDTPASSPVMENESSDWGVVAPLATDKSDVGVDVASPSPQEQEEDIGDEVTIALSSPGLTQFAPDSVISVCGTDTVENVNEISGVPHEDYIDAEYIPYDTPRQHQGQDHNQHHDQKDQEGGDAGADVELDSDLDPTPSTPTKQSPLKNKVQTVAAELVAATATAMTTSAHEIAVSAKAVGYRALETGRASLDTALTAIESRIAAIEGTRAYVAGREVGVKAIESGMALVENGKVAVESGKEVTMKMIEGGRETVTQWKSAMGEGVTTVGGWVKQHRVWVMAGAGVVTAIAGLALVARHRIELSRHRHRY